MFSALFFSTAQCLVFLLSCVTISERVIKETQGLDSFGALYNIKRKNVALLRLSQSALTQSLTTYMDFSLVFKENVVLRRCESKTKVDVFKFV